MIDFRIALPVPPVSAPNPLPVPWRGSEQSEWCWAACAQMVFLFVLKKLVKKCDIANFLKNQKICCNDPGNSKCNAPCDVPDVGAIFTHWAVRSDQPTGPLSFADLASEIDPGGRAVEAGFCKGSTGHLVILRGAREAAGGKQWVFYNDPASGQGKCAYDVVRYKHWGTWKYSWTGIQR